MLARAELSRFRQTILWLLFALPGGADIIDAVCPDDTVEPGWHQIKVCRVGNIRLHSKPFSDGYSTQRV